MDKYGYTLVNLIRYLFGYTNLDIFRITKDIEGYVSIVRLSQLDIFFWLSQYNNLNLKRYPLTTNPILSYPMLSFPILSYPRGRTPR